MRKTIRVDIPISSPEKTNKLAKGILAMAKEMGDKCPIKKEVIELLGDLTEIQETNREEAARLHAKAQATTLVADTALGVASGQNINTPKTMYNTISIIKDTLLLEYRGREETLSGFGFNVVIGTAKSPTKKKNE